MRGYGVIMLALCAAVGASACKSKKNPPATGAPAVASPEAPEPVPVDDRLFRLFAAGGPAMPVPLQALRFDMPRAELETVVPDLAPHGIWRGPLGLEGVMLRASFFGDAQTLRYVEVNMPAGGKPVLVKLWGEPVTARLTGTKNALYWQNPGASIQAVLEETGGTVKLSLWPFTPWKELLGSAPATLGFETKPILGMSEQEVLAEYAHLHPQKVNDRRIDLYLNGHEFQYTHIPVVLTLENGAVKKLYFKLHYANYPALKDQMIAAFAAKFGAPARVDGIYTTWREREPSIKMDHNQRASQFVFWLER